MISPSVNILDSPLEGRAFMALQEAVEEVIEDHRHRGLPLHISRDGKVVAVLLEGLQAMPRR